MTAKKDTFIDNTTQTTAIDTNKVKDKTIQDLIIVILMTIAVALIFSSLDLFEKFHEWASIHEDFEIDDLFLSFLVFASSLIWFSFRRWRAALKAIKKQKEMERQLEASLKGELVVAARKAGMVEVATGVLHNVGNVLNSIGVTTHSMYKILKNSRAQYLSNVSNLIQENKEDIGRFLETDQRGKKIPEFLIQLSDNLTIEKNYLLKELEILKNYVNHIAEIISLQHAYSKTGGIREPMLLSELVEDAININKEALTRHKIMIKREYENLSTMYLDRIKILQIVTNLINNAKYALSSSNNENPSLTVAIKKFSKDKVIVQVIDNGIGIPKENLSQIFNYGFTTKEDGHGFGLYNSSQAAKEMGGKLSVSSDGSGKGSTFTLELPVNTRNDMNFGDQHDRKKPK